MLPGLTVFEMTKKRPEDKRKRHLNDDPSNIEGFIGPWGKYVDEKTVMKPNEVCYTLPYFSNGGEDCHIFEWGRILFTPSLNSFE